MRTKFIAVLLCVVMTIGGFGQPLPDSVLFNPAVKHGTLPNGFNYYILNYDSPEKKTEVYFVVNAGTYHQEQDEHEIAHLIEHLSLRGTQHFPQGVRNFFRDKGLKGGRELKASTGLQTSYHIGIPDGDMQLFDLALLAARDWAKGRLYKPEEIEDEKAAVLQEHISANRDDLNLSQWLLLDQHPLYKRHSLEEQATRIAAIKPDKIQAFDRRWYTPDLQSVFIIGNFSVQEVEKKVQQLFSDLTGEQQAEEITLESIYKKYDVPLSGKNKVLINQGEGKSVRLTILQKRKSQYISRQSSPTAQLQESLFDELYYELFKNRLDHIKKLYPAVGSLSHSIGRKNIHPLAGIDALITSLQIDDVTNAQQILINNLTELQRVAKWGFTEKEFNDAKLMMIERFSRNSNNASSRSLSSDLFEFHLNHSAFPRDVFYAKSILLNQISLKTFNDFARQWIEQENNTDYVFSASSDNASKLPTLDQLVSWKKVSKDIKVTKYEDKKIRELSTVTLAQTIPAYKLSSVETISAISLELSNGVKVIIKPLQIPKGHGHPASIFIKSLHVNQGNEPSLIAYPPDVFNRLRNHTGAGNLSYKELREWKQDKNKFGALLCAPVFDGTNLNVYGYSNINNYEALLRMLFWHLVQPQIDTKALHADFNEAITAMPSRKPTIDDAVFSFFGGKPDMGKISIYSSKQIDAFTRQYRKQLSEHQNLTFVITGNFTVDQIKDLTVRYLSLIPNTVSKKTNVKPANTVQKITPKSSQIFENRSISLPGDSNATLKIRMVFPLKDSVDSWEFPMLQILHEVLEPLLFARLREKEKGVYSVGGQFIPIKGSYFLIISFETAPGNADRLIAAAKEEIASLFENGITEQSFRNSLAAFRKNIQNQLKQPDYWLNYIVGQLYSGNLSDDIFKRESMIDNITLPVLRSFAQRNIDINHCLLFKQF